MMKTKWENQIWADARFLCRVAHGRDYSTENLNFVISLGWRLQLERPRGPTARRGERVTLLMSQVHRLQLRRPQRTKRISLDWPRIRTGNLSTDFHTLTSMTVLSWERVLTLNMIFRVYIWTEWIFLQNLWFYPVWFKCFRWGNGLNVLGWI